jgi:hypothetical protein
MQITSDAAQPTNHEFQQIQDQTHKLSHLSASRTLDTMHSRTRAGG